MILQASVIIPTFDDWGILQTCLDCLAEQTAVLENFEVIVANNNPSPAVPASLRLPGNARVIHAEKPGSYAARNVALAEAKGDVLFFTDSDCQPDTHWIENGLAAISKLGPLGRIAGEVQLFPRGKTWNGVELYDRVYWMRQDFYATLGWCVTANLVARRAVFDLVGPFADNRFSGGDKEWNLRATEAGAELVYNAETIIRHPARSDFAELAKKCRRLAGGEHRDVKVGLREPRRLGSFFKFVSSWKIRQLDTVPDLTEEERRMVLKVAFKLGIVELVEVIRLRYLFGRPRRS